MDLTRAKVIELDSNALLMIKSVIESAKWDDPVHALKGSFPSAAGGFLAEASHAVF